MKNYKMKWVFCALVFFLTLFQQSCKKDRPELDSSFNELQVENFFINSKAKSQYFVGEGKNYKLSWENAKVIKSAETKYLLFKVSDDTELVFSKLGTELKGYYNKHISYVDKTNHKVDFVFSTNINTDEIYLATYYKNRRMAFLPFNYILREMGGKAILGESISMNNFSGKIALGNIKDNMIAVSFWEHFKCWITFSVYKENGNDGPGCYSLDVQGIWDTIKSVVSFIAAESDGYSSAPPDFQSIQNVLNWGSSTGLSDYGQTYYTEYTPINTPDGGGTVDPNNGTTIGEIGGGYISPDVNLLIDIVDLEPTYQQFLVSHQNLANPLVNYVLENGGNTSENRALVIMAIQYAMVYPYTSITEFKQIFIPSFAIISGPNGSNWDGNDDEILVDPDQTTYQQYQDAQAWPTVDRQKVIRFEDFVSNRKDASGYDVNCLVLAKEQLGKAGYTCSGYLPGSQTFQIYKESTGVDVSKTKQAVTYIIDALSQKIPVLIGIDNRQGTPSTRNADGSTDHFVVIVGMGTDTKGKYFQFVDSATSNRTDGASYSNRLYYDSTTGKISGKTAIKAYRELAGMHDYIVTQVRKSIKK